MATFGDLTDYSYLPADAPMVNVGWLGTGVDFRRGSVPESVVAALLVLAADQKNVMRGVHSCEFCGEESPVRLAAPVPGGLVSLGMGELHIQARDGVVFSSPSLVVHYIIEHNYCPPEEFQQAVLDSVDATSQADLPPDGLKP